MDKNFELELVDYELKSVIKSKIMLIKLLSKKDRQDEHSKILTESLEQARTREQELLNERIQIEKTNSDKRNTNATRVTQDNETKV